MNQSAIVNQQFFLENKNYKFIFSFWIICLLVSIGFYNPISLGFYQFRIIDLVFIVSFSYYLIFINKHIFSKKAGRLITFYLIFILLRVFIELIAEMNLASLKTLFGMTITYLAPVIFFVVRETQVNKTTLTRLIWISCLVSFISQLGLLSMNESNVGGVVDIGKILGIPSRRLQEWNYSFTDTTITIWRALSVGFTFALLFVKTNGWIKILAILAFILQFAGGSGTRSSIFFLGTTPLVLAFWYGHSTSYQKIKKIFLYLLITILLGGFYIWGPLGPKVAKEHTTDKSTHAERVEEVFLIFKGFWDPSYSSIQTFNGRMYVWDQYVRIISSNPIMFFFGQGIRYVGFNVVDEHHQLINGGMAHNMILDIWGNTGIFNVIFFIIILKYVFHDLKSLLQVSSLNSEFKIIGITFSVAILYFFQYMLFQAVALDRSFMIVFYLTAGTLRPIRELIINEIKYKKNKLKIPVTINNFVRKSS